MPRSARWNLEDDQGNESSSAVLGDPFFLPGIEIGFNPGHNPLDRSDEQRGVDARLPLAENEYEPEGSVVIRNYLNYVGALLAVQFGAVDSTPGGVGVTDPDGNNIPAGVTRHVFSKIAGVRPKSAQVTLNYGDTYLEARGVTVPSTEFALDDDGVKVNGTLMANYVKRLNSAPTGGDPADYDPFDILPLRRRNVSVDWGIGTANIDSIGFTLEQALEYVRDLGSRTGFPSDTERANSPEGFLRLSGTLTRRNIDDQDWDALVSAEAFAVVISMISEQDIDPTSYPYSMWVEAPLVQYSGGSGPETLKNQARHQADYDWVASYDEDSEFDVQVTLVNDVDTYEFGS